ncbi:MAG: HAMP domain-containing sensor histidine kinase [Candidatus Marinimicrobia bacterium]|nr:HAMP domain-containing sensor histidine kinase [Candidatus Neomarinimicrobiota bacterium]
MKLFTRLAWKLALFTGLLILLTVLALSIPVYWLTRNTLEDQLADHLAANITLLSGAIDPGLISFIIQYPESQFLRDSLETSLKDVLQKYSAGTIYILDSENIILLSAGNKLNAMHSALIHKPEIEKARETGIGFAPLYQDESGSSFKSVYKLFEIDEYPGIIIGLDADAHFLKYTEQLRQRILIIGGSVLLISVIAVMILAQTLTQPLRHLTEFAKNIGRGRAEPPILQKRRDEIGFLGKTMEEMRQEIVKREKENKELIASVAHEIRNPLAGMQVNAELLLEATQNHKDLHTYSCAVTNEIANLSNIVDNFLAYARPIDATLESLSIRTLIDEIIDTLKRDFPNHQFTINGNEKALVHPNKIKHAFFNLLKNACESSNERDLIDVRITRNNDDISIAFQNRGEPIPSQIQSQIFEAFFSTKGSGVGLGLSIAKSVVEQHGGHIRLTHSDADGTEFVIDLPAG